MQLSCKPREMQGVGQQHGEACIEPALCGTHPPLTVPALTRRDPSDDSRLWTLARQASALTQRTVALTGPRLLITALVLTVPILTYPAELHPGSIARISAPLNLNRLYRTIVTDLAPAFAHRIHTLEVRLPSTFSKLMEAVATCFPRLASLTVRNPTPLEAFLPGSAASTHVGMLAASLLGGKLKLLRHADVETTCDEELASLALLTPLTSLAGGCSRCASRPVCRLKLAAWAAVGGRPGDDRALTWCDRVWGGVGS
ncbi:MAG: hypothetical protein WDW36_009868 [Sanguina aurantia]